MKKIKSLILCLLAGILVFASAVSYGLEKSTVVSAEENDTEIEGEDIDKPLIDKPLYVSFSGVIKKITKSQTQPDSFTLYTVSDEGLEANIIISADTYIVDNVTFKEGDRITIFYDAARPMIMIYPPQYSAEVALLTPDNQFVKYDVFNKELISSDGTLKLLISDDTKVVSKDGSVYKGTLENQKLLVFYTKSTKSIPAQTSPDKIIVVSAESTQDSGGGTGFFQFLLRLLGITVKR